MKQPLIILTGPTAVGKTELSIALAKAVDGEIISADSMQVYKYMDIGTAKIMPKERKSIKHYLIDELNPDEEFNVVKFKEDAVHYLDEIHKKKKIPIMVGGTGFYIQAVLYDIQFEQTELDTSYRKELESMVKEKGAAYLHHLLHEIDEESAKLIHQNNIKKVIRALEYYKQTGQAISIHNETQKKRCSPYEFLYFVLENKREILYDRIDTRVDAMIKNGLIEEVDRLKKAGYSRNLVSMEGLGYKEIWSYLEGELTMKEAVTLLKRNTRHFAKRQLTWFRREKDVIWVNKSDFSNDDSLVLQFLLEHIKERYPHIKPT